MEERWENSQFGNNKVPVAVKLFVVKLVVVKFVELISVDIIPVAFTYPQ